MQSFNDIDLSFDPFEESRDKINPHFISGGVLVSEPSTSSSRTNTKAQRRSVIYKKLKTAVKSPSKPRKRIRRPIPEKKEYIPENRPTEVDVISGRGGRSNIHTGNRRYWVKVLYEHPAYLACKPCDQNCKKAIAKGVYDYVTENQQGRFLQLYNKTKRWFVLPQKVALMKIKQALRDRHVPLWAENLVPAGEMRSSSVQNNKPAAIQMMEIKPENPQKAYCIAMDDTSNTSFNTLATIDLKQLNFMNLGTDSSSWVKSIDLVYDLIDEETLTGNEDRVFWNSMFSEALTPEFAT
jgi:hypothetical protein